MSKRAVSHGYGLRSTTSSLPNVTDKSCHGDTQSPPNHLTAAAGTSRDASRAGSVQTQQHALAETSSTLGPNIEGVSERGEINLDYYEFPKSRFKSMDSSLVAAAQHQQPSPSVTNGFNIPRGGQRATIPAGMQNILRRSMSPLRNASGAQQQQQTTTTTTTTTQPPNSSIAPVARRGGGRFSRRPIPPEYTPHVSEKQHIMPASWWALESTQDASSLYAESSGFSDLAAVPLGDMECTQEIKNRQHCWECCECQARFDYPLYAFNSFLSAQKSSRCLLDACTHERCGFCLEYDAVLIVVKYKNGEIQKRVRREERLPVDDLTMNVGPQMTLL